MIIIVVGLKDLKGFFRLNEVFYLYIINDNMQVNYDMIIYL